jgi:4-amino-4-deoxy-L-arabinose transferase-like glycosyltransferase
LAYRGFAALCGFLFTALTYVFVRRTVGPASAACVALLTAVNYSVTLNSTLALADIPFAVVSLLSLIAAATAPRGPGIVQSIATGFLSGLPALFRINGLGFPPVIALYAYLAAPEASRRMRFFRAAAIFLAGLLPFALWLMYKSSFPESDSEGSYFNAVTRRTFADQAEIVVTAFLAYFRETNLALTGLNIRTGFAEGIVPAIMILGMYVAWRRGERLLVPLTIVQYCGLCLSTAGERYLIFLLPGLYLFLALGALHAGRWIAAYRPTFEIQRALAGGFVLLLLGNFIHGLIPISHALAPIEAGGPESERSAPFFTAARYLKTQDADAIVLTTRPRILRYLSGRKTIALMRSGAPEHETWINDSSELRRLILERRPNWVFSDAKDAALYDEVFRILRNEGRNLRLVEEGSTPPRYQLWEITQAR